MKRKQYSVWYGAHTSKYRFTSWAEAARFMKYMLDQGERINKVTTEDIT